MLYLNNLSQITGYDFDQYTHSLDMSNKLFCTFTLQQNIDENISRICSRYEILYEKIFILECTGQEEFILTYNVDFNNVSSFIDNTILVHRKKHTNTLYTINALNELIISLNNGYLDTNYMVDWNNYKNSVLLTKEGKLEIIKTKLHDIIAL